MRISTKDWKNYIDKLSKLNKEAGDKMSDYVARHSFNDPNIIDYAYGLVTKYGEGSASLSAMMYDAIAEMEGKILPSAEVAETPEYGEVAKAINGVKKHSQNPNSYGNVVNRLVKRTGADTMLKNADRDGAEFAWVPSGDTCAFCIALASRGWQHISKKSLKNGHAEHIHANCDCNYTVRFDGRSTVEGYDPDEYLEIYENAEGSTPDEKINSIRAKYRAENRDKINAQKRAAYAAKKENNLQMNYGDISKINPKIIDAKGDENSKITSSIKVEFEKGNIYISDKIIEEPNVIMDKVEPVLKEAFDLVGRDHGPIPDVVIADVMDFPNNIGGRYLYDSNTVFMVPVLFDESEEYKNRNIRLATHELSHWSDCFEIAKKHPGLSESQLMPFVNNWAKEQLDNLGINKYNIDDITPYASDKYADGFFFEAYVEKRLKDIFGF